MELVNELSREPDGPDSRFAAETAVSLIQPYAPHVAEELWERLGHERLWEAPWPEADPALLEVETVEVVVQVNGQASATACTCRRTRPRTSSSRSRARPSGCRRTWTAPSWRARSSCPGKLVNFVTSIRAGRRVRRARAASIGTNFATEP